MAARAVQRSLAKVSAQAVLEAISGRSPNPLGQSRVDPRRGDIEPRTKLRRQSNGGGGSAAPTGGHHSRRPSRSRGERAGRGDGAGDAPHRGHCADAERPSLRRRGPGRSRDWGSVSSCSRARGQAHRFADVAAWARLLSAKPTRSPGPGGPRSFSAAITCLAMGSVSGVARHAAEVGRELFVVWLDAHSDFNTPLTSPSGNMHGMSLAMLSREPGLESVFGDEPHGFVRSRAAATCSAFARSTRANGGSCRTGASTWSTCGGLDEDGFAVSIRRIIDRVRARNGPFACQSRRRLS